MCTFKENVATLIKNGAIEVKNVEVISASLSKKGQYDAINLITKDVYPSYTKDKDEAEYSKKDTHCISVLLNIATNAMMHCDNVSLLRDYCRRHPGALAILLSNSKLNLISQEVSEGQTYQSINLDGVVDREWEEDYSQILYNIVDFVKIDDKIFDKLLDKALSE